MTGSVITRVNRSMAARPISAQGVTCKTAVPTVAAAHRGSAIAQIYLRYQDSRIFDGCRALRITSHPDSSAFFKAGRTMRMGAGSDVVMRPASFVRRAVNQVAPSVRRAEHRLIALAI